MESKPTREELEKRIRELEEKLSEYESAEQRLLKILADEWDNIGPPGIVDVQDLAEKLDLDPEEVRKIIKPLFERAAVDMDHYEKAVYLTPEGYDYAKSQ